jgi:hypothetical protein
MAAADPNVAQWYERAVSEGPKLLADVYRHLILAKHVLATMGLDHGAGSSRKRTD